MAYFKFIKEQIKTISNNMMGEMMNYKEDYEKTKDKEKFISNYRGILNYTIAEFEDMKLDNEEILFKQDEEDIERLIKSCISERDKSDEQIIAELEEDLKHEVMDVHAIDFDSISKNKTKYEKTPICSHKLIPEFTLSEDDILKAAEDLTKDIQAEKIANKISEEKPVPKLKDFLKGEINIEDKIIKTKDEYETEDGIEVITNIELDPAILNDSSKRAKFLYDTYHQLIRFTAFTYKHLSYIDTCKDELFQQSYGYLSLLYNEIISIGDKDICDKLDKTKIFFENIEKFEELIPNMTIYGENDIEGNIKSIYHIFRQIMKIGALLITDKKYILSLTSKLLDIIYEIMSEYSHDNYMEYDSMGKIEKIEDYYYMDSVALEEEMLKIYNEAKDALPSAVESKEEKEDESGIVVASIDDVLKDFESAYNKASSEARNMAVNDMLESIKGNILIAADLLSLYYNMAEDDDREEKFEELYDTKFGHLRDMFYKVSNIISKEYRCLSLYQDIEEMLNIIDDSNDKINTVRYILIAFLDD